MVLMEPLFPNDMISGSVKNQQELDDAFKKYPTFSKTYVQTAVYWEETRKWYEKNWPKVFKYLDNGFFNKFRLEAEHHARAWEFHLVAVLLEKGFSPQEKTWEYGPDFCINLSGGKRIWIEAITCDRGEVDPVEPYPEMKSGQIYSFGGNIEDTHRPRALRITSAIGTKFEKFKEYLKNSENSGVKPEDCLIIAVNGSAIQHFAEAGMLFKRSVFGQGPDVLVKVPGKEKLQGGFYKPVPVIPKKTETQEYDVPATFMEMDEFSPISAVIYCGHTVSYSWLNGFNVGDDFLFAYHSKPNNPIPEGTFKFGRGIRKDTALGQISDQNQGEGDGRDLT